MITVTISINGEPIYTRTAVNIGTLTDGERCSYRVDTGEKIVHRPDDGAVKLARMMLNTIHEFGVDEIRPEGG